MSLPLPASWNCCVAEMPFEELRLLAMQALDRLFQTDDEYGELDVRFLETDSAHSAYMIRRSPSARWTTSDEQQDGDDTLAVSLTAIFSNESK